VGKFLWWLDQNGLAKDVHAVTSQTIRAFLAYVKDNKFRWNSSNPRAQREVCQTTVERYHACLKAFWNWLIREEIAHDSPVNKVKVAKPLRKVMKAIEPEDMQKLLAALNGRDFESVRNKAILLLLLDTGLRVSECANLKLADLDLDRQTLKVMGKGSKERLARIGYGVQKALWRYLGVRHSNSDALWVDRSGEPIKPDGIKLMVRRQLPGAAALLHMPQHWPHGLHPQGIAPLAPLGWRRAMSLVMGARR